MEKQLEIVALKEKIIKIQRWGEGKCINLFVLESHSDQMYKNCVFKQINKLVLNFLFCSNDIKKYFKVHPYLPCPSYQSELNYTPVLEVLKHHLN